MKKKNQIAFKIMLLKTINDKHPPKNYFGGCLFV